MFNWTSYNESLVRRGEIILDFGTIENDRVIEQSCNGHIRANPQVFVQAWKAGSDDTENYIKQSKNFLSLKVKDAECATGLVGRVPDTTK